MYSQDLGERYNKSIELVGAKARYVVDCYAQKSMYEQQLAEMEAEHTKELEKQKTNFLEQQYLEKLDSEKEKEHLRAKILETNAKHQVLEEKAKYIERLSEVEKKMMVKSDEMREKFSTTHTKLVAENARTVTEAKRTEDRFKMILYLVLFITAFGLFYL